MFENTGRDAERHEVKGRALARRARARRTLCGFYVRRSVVYAHIRVVGRFDVRECTQTKTYTRGNEGGADILRIKHRACVWCWRDSRFLYSLVCNSGMYIAFVYYIHVHYIVQLPAHATHCKITCAPGLLQPEYLNESYRFIDWMATGLPQAP